MLLREKPCTVSDLAAALELTKNAVRAHLITLERDGLVHQVGDQAGYRKPHFSYELTKEAGDLFSKAYGPILNQVVAVMKDRLGTEETESLLREVGHQMAPSPSADESSVFEERLDQSLKSIEKLGGQASIVREDGKVFIRSAGCPLSAATSDHGEVCKMVETILSEIIGAPVQQACQRKSSPQCCFEIQTSPEGEMTKQAS